MDFVVSICRCFRCARFRVSLLAFRRCIGLCSIPDGFFPQFSLNNRCLDSQKFCRKSSFGRCFRFDSHPDVRCQLLLFVSVEIIMCRRNSRILLTCRSEKLSTKTRWHCCIVDVLLFLVGARDSVRCMLRLLVVLCR